MILSLAIAAFIPLAAYLSLLPRALVHPEASWGTLRTVRDVVAHAGADLYRPYDLGWSGAFRPDAWPTISARSG